MKKILLLACLSAFVFGADFTAVKFSPEQTEKIMKELHSRLQKCQTDDRTKKLLKNLEEAFYPLEDLDFSHDYDPKVIDELRRLDRENQQFLAKFVLNSNCKL